MIIFNDRLVQYPNRVKLVPVSGQDGVYDVSRAEGSVQQEGTPLNAENLNQIYKDVAFDFYPKSGGALNGDIRLGIHTLSFGSDATKEARKIYSDAPGRVKFEKYALLAEQLYDGYYSGGIAPVFSRRNPPVGKFIGQGYPLPIGSTFVVASDTKGRGKGFYIHPMYGERVDSPISGLCEFAVIFTCSERIFVLAYSTWTTDPKVINKYWSYIVTGTTGYDSQVTKIKISLASGTTSYSAMEVGGGQT